jgi:hypothetical protein
MVQKFPECYLKVKGNERSLASQRVAQMFLLDQSFQEAGTRDKEYIFGCFFARDLLFYEL